MLLDTCVGSSGLAPPLLYAGRRPLGITSRARRGMSPRPTPTTIWTTF